MANTATRLFNLILLLQRQPNSSASQLAGELDVSVRTIQRYIVMLEEIGVPVYAERGSQGGYSLMRGYRMPPLILSPDEAVAVYLGTTLIENVWGKLFRGPAQSALSKIENVLPQEQLNEITWARGSLVNWGMPRTNPGLDQEQFETLYQATRHGLQVRIHYQGKKQTTPAWRLIDPYVLVYSWGQQYCVAYCHLRNAMRSFRVDRILALERLASGFTKPEGFDPEQFLNESRRDQMPQEIRLYFAPDSAQVARDYRCCWDSFDQRPDGSVIASFHATDLDAATHRVMGILVHARIIAPQALKDKVAAAAATIVEQYRDKPALEPEVVQDLVSY